MGKTKTKRKPVKAGSKYKKEGGVPTKKIGKFVAKVKLKSVKPKKK